MMTQLQSVGVKEFPLVIKGDVQGSIEAIAGALDKLGTDEVRARIVHSGAGGITESDVSPSPKPPTRPSSASTFAPIRRHASSGRA